MKHAEASAHVINEKTQPEEFDVVILGGGTGSTIAVWTFAGEGKHVAVVARKYIGGSCPNIACLPSHEHHPQREGRIVLSPKQGIRHYTRRLRN